MWAEIVSYVSAPMDDSNLLFNLRTILFLWNEMEQSLIHKQTKTFIVDQIFVTHDTKLNTHTHLDFNNTILGSHNNIIIMNPALTICSNDTIIVSIYSIKYCKVACISKLRYTDDRQDSTRLL